MADASALEIRRIKCLFCDSTFRDNFNVRRHINSKHPEMAKEILKINCSLCGLIYIRKKEEKPAVEMCEECKKRTDIPPPETYHFPDEEEFKKWKQKMELDTSTRYMRSRRTTNLQDGSTKVEFPCYRSTFLSPKGKRLKVKMVGSAKKVSTCPAKLICEFAPDGAVTVSFFSDHKGHSLDANKMIIKEKKKEKVKKEKPVALGESSMDMHLDYSYSASNSCSNECFMNLSHEESLSNHYNSDLDIVLSQIENEGQVTSNSKMWLSSFCNAVQSLATNKSNNLPLRPNNSKTPIKKVFFRESTVPEPQITYEAQTSNRMTEEERQSIIQMVLDEL